MTPTNSSEASSSPILLPYASCYSRLESPHPLLRCFSLGHVRASSRTFTVAAGSAAIGLCEVLRSALTRPSRDEYMFHRCEQQQAFTVRWAHRLVRHQRSGSHRAALRVLVQERANGPALSGISSFFYFTYDPSYLSAPRFARGLDVVSESSGSLSYPGIC
jgi:hypothetical protein